MDTIDIVEIDALKKQTVLLFGIPTAVNGVPYVLITHMDTLWFRCKQVDEPKLVSPAGLPAPEDPQGQCGLLPPFQRYRIEV